MNVARKFFAIGFAAFLLGALPAYAQFPFGNRQPDYPPQQQGDSDLAIRVDRLEQQLRQLTGQIEQLQYQLQQTQRGAVQPPQQQNIPPQQQQTPPPLQQQLPPTTPQRRGDAFDPAADPDAPGRPQNLGQIPAQQRYQQPNAPQQPQGPMVLAPNQNQNQNFNQQPVQQPQQQPQQQAVLPPSNSPKDAYDLAYGYVLRRDYGLAEQSFRGFIEQYPNDRNVPLASYWLGESMFMQRKFTEAAEVFLDIYNKWPQSNRAPDSLLRLGQSLAQLGKKEAACGSLGAVLSKYPKASPTVKKNAENEQKRIGC